MYKHFLVPLDDSMLATELVRQSVLLAKALGAKITFFHAQEDFGSSSMAALERVVWPSLHEEHVAGDAKAVLAKAAVVAREAGITHDTMIAISDRPYEAILSAVESRGCDLLVIASHGRRGLRGLVLGSQTQNVLQQAALPVLVLAVESNLPDWEKIAPLATIRDEHRSLAAVVHSLEVLVREAREHGTPPRFDLLKAIVYYIRNFPETLHHPKEDQHLFPKLRERTSEFNDTLDELERQHREGKPLLDELEGAIARYEADPAHGLATLAEVVARYVEAQQQHMRLEMRVVLPAAYKHLTDGDWEEIGKAFAGNGDPRFSADGEEEFRELCVRILNLVPDKSRAEQRRA